MKFRTEIEPMRLREPSIGPDDGIVMLGSCFTDEVGERLAFDGFRVTHNPMGPLYNPMSILHWLDRASMRQPYTQADLTLGPDGLWHCLDFATRYTDADPDALLHRLNADIEALADKLAEAKTVIITLGSAFVYTLQSTGRTVGNCHKFPASCFSRERLHPNICALALCGMLQRIPLTATNIIFTVSPVRHTADGLHGNQLSKATLLLALDEAMRTGDQRVTYFPAYEILNDDLRDYRFYAADLKHPSPMAVEYIYDHFSARYFTPATRAIALQRRQQSKRDAHRPIL